MLNKGQVGNSICSLLSYQHTIY